MSTSFSIKHAVAISLCLHGAIVLLPGDYLSAPPPDPQPRGDMYVEIPLEESWDWQDEAIADLAMDDLPETKMFRPLHETRAEFNLPSPIDDAVFPVPDIDIPELDSPQDVSTHDVLEQILEEEPPVETQQATVPLPEPAPREPAVVGLEDGSVIDQENPLEVPYPQMARRRGQEGEVTVHIEVDAGGQVQEVSIARSSGYPLLDNAVLRAVKRHHYEPLVQDGRAMAAEFDYKVQFVLK